MDIEITQYTDEGYKPIIDFNEWRVAILNDIDELYLENISTMQKHNETDEVFVLLKGNCQLYSGGNGNKIGKIAIHVMIILQHNY